MSKADWKSFLPRLNARVPFAKRKALIAAAQVVINEVKSGLRGGYTSGDFVTGRVLNSVTRSEPEEGPDGMFIEVGSNLDYALFWELGHDNLFTRGYEREEIWVPAMISTAEAQRLAFARVFKRECGR